jgi:hypothetical protein
MELTMLTVSYVCYSDTYDLPNLSHYNETHCNNMENIGPCGAHYVN